MRPPVRTTAAAPRVACASSSRTINRTAVACASTFGSLWTMTLACDKRTAPSGRAAGSGGRRGRLGLHGQGGVVPDVRAGGGPGVETGQPGGRGERRGVGLVGVEPAQLLGQLLAERAAG